MNEGFFERVSEWFEFNGEGIVLVFAIIALITACGFGVSRLVKNTNEHSAKVEAWEWEQPAKPDGNYCEATYIGGSFNKDRIHSLVHEDFDDNYYYVNVKFQDADGFRKKVKNIKIRPEYSLQKYADILPWLPIEYETKEEIKDDKKIIYKNTFLLGELIDEVKEEVDYDTWKSSASSFYSGSFNIGYTPNSSLVIIGKIIEIPDVGMKFRKVKKAAKKYDQLNVLIEFMYDNKVGKAPYQFDPAPNVLEYEKNWPEVDIEVVRGKFYFRGALLELK